METYNLNRPVKMLEALLLDDKGIHVILKVMVVERQAKAVEAQRRKELAVLVREEVLEELVEEEVVLFATEDLKQGCADLALATGETVDEVFHHHPAAESGLKSVSLS